MSASSASFCGRNILDPVIVENHEPAGDQAIRQPFKYRNFGARRVEIHVREADGSARFAARAPPPKLSVILTSYNSARYLPAALQALAAQARPADELIVIDDGSADDSVAIIDSLLARFAEPLLVQNPRNLGT